MKNLPDIQIEDERTAGETILETIRAIRPVSEDFRGRCKARWNSLCKPIGGFGRLEDMVSQIGAIQKTVFPDIGKAAVVIMGADNGVVREQISQCGSEVTAQVLKNIALQKSSVCMMAKFRPADVIPVDIGLRSPAGDGMAGIVECPVCRGTGDIAAEAAMTRGQALSAIAAGIRIALDLGEQGYRILIPGEMGIGNTTTSTACVCALFGIDPSEAAGPGAGLSREGVRHKAEVIRQALNLHFPSGTEGADIVDILAKLGGLDIAGMCGLFLGAARAEMPVLIDGFIAALSAYMAFRLSDLSGEYMIPSHASAEPGDRILMEKLGKDPGLCLDMHLGEGTGASALLVLLDEALYVYRNLPSFGSSNIEAYKPFS